MTFIVTAHTTFGEIDSKICKKINNVHGEIKNVPSCEAVSISYIRFGLYEESFRLEDIIEIFFPIDDRWCDGDLIIVESISVLILNEESTLFIKCWTVLFFPSDPTRKLSVDIFEALL